MMSDNGTDLDTAKALPLMKALPLITSIKYHRERTKSKKAVHIIVCCWPCNMDSLGTGLIPCFFLSGNGGGPIT